MKHNVSVMSGDQISRLGSGHSFVGDAGDLELFVD